ncbi:MAG: hypothetical protein ACLRZG_08870 [Streptococcus sp.]
MQASSSHKASKTRDFNQPSQALKEGRKTLEMLTAKNHTAGGYRTDDSYAAWRCHFRLRGTALLLPMAAISVYSKSALSAGELAAALSVLGGQAGHQAGNSRLAGAREYRTRARKSRIQPLRSLGKQTSNQPSASTTNTQTTPTTSKPTASKPGPT